MGLSFDKLQGEAVKSSVKYMKLVNGNNTFRILPDSVMPCYTYWIKGANGKDLPFEALQFNRETEKFENQKSCPVKDMGLQKEVKQKDGSMAMEDLRCQWSYKCQVINQATKTVEVLQLKKGMLSEIISVAQQLGIDPTNLDTGTWITVERKKTGPSVFNVEYKVQQLMCKSAPLEDEFRALLTDEVKTMSEMFKLETYDEQYARIIKHTTGESDKEDDGKADKEALNELKD